MTRAVVIAPSKLDPVGDRLLAHPGPAGEEEVDDQHREEHLDDRERRRGGDDLQQRIGGLDGHRLGGDAGAAAELADKVVDKPFEICIDFEQGTQGLAYASDAAGQQTHPFGRRKDDRRNRDVGDGEKEDDAEERGEPRRHPPPLKPFEHRHQSDRDHQGGGDRKEEFGAGAQSEGQSEDQRRAHHQRQRGEQPVAAEGGRLRLQLEALDRLLDCVVALAHRRGQCPSRGALRSLYLVPLAQLERALLAELDFESSASTNSATGARDRAIYLVRRGPGRNRTCERTQSVSAAMTPGARTGRSPFRTRSE